MRFEKFDNDIITKYKFWNVMVHLVGAEYVKENDCSIRML